MPQFHWMQIFADKLVEVMNVEEDYIWIHDYHLLVLPSLLRKKFNTMRCGLFLHSPFPSSEMFRTFPKRDELLRSMLNADLVGQSLSLKAISFYIIWAKSSIDTFAQCQ